MIIKNEDVKILELIKECTSFVIFVHRYPEGDAIGSQLALGQILRKFGKEVDMLNYDPVPWQYKFLPGCNLIRVMTEFDRDYDCGFVLDCSDFESETECTNCDCIWEES